MSTNTILLVAAVGLGVYIYSKSDQSTPNTISQGGNTFEAERNNLAAADYLRKIGYNVDELLANGTWTLDRLFNAKLIDVDEYHRRKYPTDYGVNIATGVFGWDPYNRSTGSQMSGAESFRSGTDPEMSGGMSGSISSSSGTQSISIGEYYADTYRQEYNSSGSLYGYWYAGLFYNPSGDVTTYTKPTQPAEVLDYVPQGVRPPEYTISASTAAYLDAKAKAKMSQNY